MKKSFKTILVSLNQKSCVETNMAMATALAKKFDANVIGLYVIPSVVLYDTPYAYGGHIMSTHLNKMYRLRAAEVEDRFKEIIRRENILGEWRQTNSSGQFIDEKLVEHGREADLIILGDNKSFQTDKEYEAQVVQSTGRPVLIVPNTLESEPKFALAQIGWDGSREAARAVFDSIPLLQIADLTQVLCINSHKERYVSGESPGAELAAGLARYDIPVETYSERTRKSVGKALIERAKAADLLIIGAYGHSRLRESIFGGVTNSVLRDLTCPVLMSC